jgi:hypothetical protein
MNYQTFTLAQKLSIINQVNQAVDKKRELIKLGIARSTYYDWLPTGGQVKSKAPHQVWNKTPIEIETKIKAYRLSHDPLQQSPARIVENLERHDGYLMAESGVKSVLVRQGLNGFLKPKKRHYTIRPKAEKFLDCVCVDDVDFLRYQPHDTAILNFIDEASYFDLESKALGHKVRQYDIITGLKLIKQRYNRYPKVLRLDNARTHHANRVKKFCLKNHITLDFITKGCPEENWPVESFHRNLNQDVIYQHGYATVGEWQQAVDEYRRFHNHYKRLRSDPIQRTPTEIAFAFTSPLTQARLKVKLQRKLWGQTRVQKVIPTAVLARQAENPYYKALFVSEMCVS